MMRHGKEFEILRKCCKCTEIKSNKKAHLKKVRSKRTKTLLNQTFTTSLTKLHNYGKLQRISSLYS